MEILIKENESLQTDTAKKTEVLNHLEGKVKEWMEDHVEKRKLWFSSDFLPADEKMNDDQEKKIKQLRDRSRGVKDEVRVACLLYTSPSPRDRTRSRMPSSA